MKKLLLFIFMGTLGLSAYSQANTYYQASPYDTIFNTPDSLSWVLTGAEYGAAGSPSLIIHFEGDFGASSEFIDIYGEGGYYIGSTQPYFDGSDCMIDSTILTIPAGMINLWAADDTIHIYGLTSPNVDFFCITNHARVILTYDYCPSGIVANLTTTQTDFCPLDASVTLTATPAGGTLSGDGLTGNSFSPFGLTPDSNYVITYSYTDTAGCPSSSSVTMNIGIAPDVIPGDTICPGNTAPLTASGPGDIIWYSDMALTNVIDTGASITSPTLTTTDTFYVSSASIDRYFMITSLSDTASMVVDHDIETGDDRGGIAVTTNYVYVVGDDGTARFNLDLTSPVAYPTRVDGIFSDLATGQLYTLYNPLVGIPDMDVINDFSVTHLQLLNPDLTLSTNVALSDSITFGYNAGNELSGIYAGNGFVIIYSSLETAWYVIDISTGSVNQLSEEDFTSFAYYSENWSNWGIAEFDGTDYSVLYRSNDDGDIHRYSILANNDVVFQAFSDLGDMASFTYAPWNNRWYFHYESSGQFGGISETLGYAAGNDSTGSMQTVLLGCPNAVTITIGCAGIEEETTTFKVYPVPSAGLLNIQSINNNSDWTVSIVNISGASVYQTQLFAGDSYHQVDLTGVAPGVYFVNFQNQLSSETIKVIIQD